MKDLKIYPLSLSKIIAMEKWPLVMHFYFALVIPNVLLLGSLNNSKRGG
jgi:hypothetical protein